jgi:amidohydrolase
MTLLEQAKALAPELISLRNELHRHPEVGLHLPRTQERVLSSLARLPLEVTLGHNLSSIGAVLRGPESGSAAVLLRADMDALPLTEVSGEQFSSEVEGVMHACGHDLHTAALVGAAKLLSARKDQLVGDVIFMFQPGEEGYDGAGMMLDEGILELSDRPVVSAYALHASLGPSIPTGSFASRPGPILASADSVSVRIIGTGGHAALPQFALDPIPVACEIVVAIQALVTRRIDIFDPAVITVGTIHAGTQRGIIPAEATFEAAVLCYSSATQERIIEGLTRLAAGIASAHGLRAEVNYHRGSPVTVNDADEYAFMASAADDAFGPGRFHELPTPAPAAEDFAKVLQRVPGSYAMFGASVNDDVSGSQDLHSPTARFDSSVIADAAAYLTTLALRRLRSAQITSTSTESSEE